MSDYAGELALAWAQLERPVVTLLATYTLEFGEGPLRVRVGLGRGGHRHLLVPCEAGFVAPVDRLPLLGLTAGQFVFDGQGDRYLDVECRDLRYEEQFLRFAADAVRYAAASDRPAAATLVVVEKWRRLFGGQLGQLTERRRRGLFAELTFLRHLLARREGLDVGAVWRGPLGDVHDFHLTSYAVEVKAVGDASESITVHGLEQLEPPPGRALVLAVAEVLEDPEGTSLRALTGEIATAFDDDSVFCALLADAGWSAADPEITYSVGSWWTVTELGQLPRLVPSMLGAYAAQEGLSHVRYDIDLQAIRRCADGRAVTDVVDEVLE